MMTLRAVLVLALLLVTTPAFSQESQLQADLRREREHLAESCGAFTAKALGGCAYALVTENPLHVALGNLAPQNGFGVGLAFVEHFTPNESWRFSWNNDAVRTASGSWRGGTYLKIVHTPATVGVVVRQPGSPPVSASEMIAPRELPIVDLFAQAIALKTLNFFGPGQESLETGRSLFGERQTIVGGSVIYPLSGLGPIDVLHPALIAGVAGRFVTIHASPSGTAPSIEQIYDDRAAPGLGKQKPFTEFQEGIRFKPSLANGWVRLNYLASAQQFRTARETRSTFNRWTLDLQHEIPLYRRESSTGPRAFNGPNDCGQAPGSAACPSVQWSRNREGMIGLRLLMSASTLKNGNQVPFYLQPTLGGSDINGERLLASYQDYRFRGPNLIALQESVEHAIWGPFGVLVLTEQGKVAANRGNLNFKRLVSSTTVGLTLRAGGFPMANFSFSWGREGHHVIASMSSTLLGGSARPRLY